ncbi:MAG: drug/metabolite transporter (DMT)-like permease [Candidatus Promineifilaceae bacterium]|jgi:drug/metabolite transporter (DMT)-like permease
MKNLSRLLILLPGTIWGISFVAVELVLIDVQPITLTLLRSLISIVMLYAFLRYVGGELPKGFREWWPFFLLAAVNQAAPFALVSWAQVTIEGGLASIYMAVMPLFTVILAAVFTKDEKLTVSKAVGAAVGLIGIVILIGPEVFSGLGKNVIAQLAVVLSSFLYAIGAIGTRFVYSLQPKNIKGWPLRLRIVASQFMMSIVMLVPVSLWLEDPFTTRPSVQTWWLLIFLGVGVTGFAAVTYFYLIEELGAGAASMTIYIIPIAGVITGILVLGEQFRWQMGVALILILGGIAITNYGGQLGSRKIQPGRPAEGAKSGRV